MALQVNIFHSWGKENWSNFDLSGHKIIALLISNKWNHGHLWKLYLQPISLIRFIQRSFPVWSGAKTSRTRSLRTGRRARPGSVTGTSPSLTLRRRKCTASAGPLDHAGPLFRRGTQSHTSAQRQRRMERKTVVDARSEPNETQRHAASFRLHQTLPLQQEQQVAGLSNPLTPLNWHF